MALSHVTREEGMELLIQIHGAPPDSQEVLCDVIRAEVHARQHAPRAATLSRIARLVAPVMALDEQRLEEACDALEREGDVVLNPGGILYATPTRAVAVAEEAGARVFSSLPTRALAKALECTVAAKGASRTIPPIDRLNQAIGMVKGVVVPAEAWAGLDRSPNADTSFLEKLDQRLEWLASGAGSLEKDGALDWRAWQVTPEGARWRRMDEGQLWWARSRFGGHHRAWTSRGSPASSPFISLSPDDADRARFALSRREVAASVLGVERFGTRVVLEVPGWLPRPEYRWLSLQASPVAESGGRRWEVSADRHVPITQLLTERLGLTLVER